MVAPTIVTMPLLLSMLLGRTIDLTNYEIGANIYDDLQYSERKINQLNSTYYVLEEDTIPYDFFGMPIDVVLRVKANYLSTSSGSLGLGGLLKGSSWMHNSAVVAVSTVYTTVNRTLRDDAPLLNGWKDRIPKSSTHFASSMTYGGWFVVLYRFRCDIPSDVTSVRKTVVDVLGTSGTMKSNAKDLWNLVKQKVMENKDVRGEVTVNTFVYSSMDLPVPINSPDSLVQNIKDFPKNVGTLGTPIFMTLKPLSGIDSSFPSVTRNNARNKDLQLVDRMFDDLRHTRNKLVKWLREDDDIEEDEEEQISDLLGKITACLRIFFSLVSDVSLYKSNDGTEISKAINAYKKGLGDTTTTYYVAYLRLKEDTGAACEKDFLHGIKGLLKVYPNEVHELGDVGSIDACKKRCLEDDHCRSIGYVDSLAVLDMFTSNYIQKKHQCWVYHRSTSTATVHTPNGYSGDLRVYDRLCL